MAAGTRTVPITPEQVLANLTVNVEQGIVDDRLETYLPLDAYGHPAEDELAATAEQGAAAGEPARDRASAHTPHTPPGSTTPAGKR